MSKLHKIISVILRSEYSQTKIVQAQLKFTYRPLTFSYFC